MNKEEFDKQNIFGKGEPNVNFAKYFSGNSYLNWIGSQSGVGIANVTFEPNVRNNWHIHLAKKGGGQILICTAGEGWFQEEGKDAQKLIPGSVVFIKANVKHWHGASSSKWFSHLAIELPGEDVSTEWLEPVDYDKLVH